MIFLLELIAFVFGVLQIILFFKVWKMCNDVRMLMNHFVPIKERMDIYDIKQQLRRDLNELNEGSLGMSTEQFIAAYGKTPEQALSEIKEKHAKAFAEIEVSFPSDVQSINTLEDLRNWMNNK